jgi:hypothetical protein
MTTSRKRVNWEPIRLEYIHDGTATYTSLADKYGVSAYTLKWHAERERWRDERKTHCLKVVDKLSASRAAAALPTIQEVNEQWLKQSKELRYMLDRMLKQRGVDGRTIMKPGITSLDLQRCIVSYSVLNKHDRIALGISDDRPPAPELRNAYDDMSEEDLIAELRRVRASSVIQ